MSSWKLVEAEPIHVNGGQTSNGANMNNNNNNGNRRQHRERRRSGGGRKHQREQESPETRQYYAHMAVQTLEYYFSPDSLIADTTIRSYLDEAGYIPIAFVCNFPEILAIGAYYEDIIAALQNSALFEVDVENETMRLHDWQKWLMPNGLGGFGLPRYIKQPQEYYANGGEWATEEQQDDSAQLAVNTAATTPTGTHSSADLELSPNASEYKPKATST